MRAMRVLPAIGTMCRGRPARARSSSRSVPLAPPARQTASVSAPSSCTTRATLMPPPPGSKSSFSVRVLCVGRTTSATLDTSMVGLSDRVTMRGKGGSRGSGLGRPLLTRSAGGRDSLRRRPTRRFRGAPLRRGSPVRACHVVSARRRPLRAMRWRRGCRRRRRHSPQRARRRPSARRTGTRRTWRGSRSGRRRP